MHHSQDEWFYVTKGTFVFQVGDKKFTLNERDCVLELRGLPHAFAQTNTGEGRLLIVYQPAGTIEAFFREASALRDPTPEESQRLFNKHDMELVGPALSV